MKSMSRVRKAAMALASAGILTLTYAVPAHVQAGGTQTWVVAFNQGNGLPTNVDQMVNSAGGTIDARIPQIGGISVTSSDPNFAANMYANASVRAVDTATPTQLIDPVADSGNSSSNNGGTYSPTGSDTQAMPDSLGYEQWDKKKLNATMLARMRCNRGARTSASS